MTVAIVALVLVKSTRKPAGRSRLGELHRQRTAILRRSTMADDGSVTSTERLTESVSSAGALTLPEMSTAVARSVSMAPGSSVAGTLNVNGTLRTAERRRHRLGVG